MSDVYKVYHAERMRAYRARLKAARPMIVKTKKQPMSVKERVRLYRERKKQLQKNQSLELSTQSFCNDNLCLDSQNVQTARPNKKPPMSAKDRVRLYRQRQKELWEKYRSSNLSVTCTSADSQCVNSAGVQARTVPVKKKQPISVTQRVRLYRERRKQLQENQILDLSLSAAGRVMEKQVSLIDQNSKKPHFLFFSLKEVDGHRAVSQVY